MVRLYRSSTDALDGFRSRLPTSWGTDRQGESKVDWLELFPHLEDHPRTCFSGFFRPMVIVVVP